MVELPPELLVFKPDNRERTRRAISRVVESAVREAGTKFISVAKVRQAGAKDNNAAQECLKAWRAGLSVAEPWTGRPEAPGPSAETPVAGNRGELAQKIRDARTDGDRETLMHELAALVASGEVDPDEAREIRGPLQEARQAAEAKRGNEPPPEDPTKLVLSSPEAMLAARALDLFVSDERRDRMLAMIAAELEADRIEHPNQEGGP